LKNNTSSDVSPQIQWEVLSPQKAKLTLTGSLDTDSIAKIWKDVTDRQALWIKNNPSSQKSLTIDASNISYLDGSGVAFLIDIQHQLEMNQGQFELIGLDSRYQALLSRFNPIESLYPKPVKNEKDGWITSLGKSSYGIYNDVRDR